MEPRQVGYVLVGRVPLGSALGLHAPHKVMNTGAQGIFGQGLV